VDVAAEPLPLPDFSCTDLGIPMRDRAAAIPNVNNPSELEEIDGTNQLWNGVPDSIKAKLEGKNFSFCGCEPGSGTDDSLKFHFFRRKLTQEQANNMALFAILKMFHHDASEPNSVLSESCLLSFINAFESVYADILMAVMKVVTESNRAGILEMLGLRSSSSSPELTDFQKFQNAILEKFKDSASPCYAVTSGAVSLDSGIKHFFEVFAGYHVRTICLEPSQATTITTIEQGMASHGVTANFANNLFMARVCSVVFEAIKDSQSGFFHPLPTRIFAAEAEETPNFFALVPFTARPFFFGGDLFSKYVEEIPLIFNKKICCCCIARDWTDKTPNVALKAATKLLLSVLCHFYWLQGSDAQSTDPDEIFKTFLQTPSNKTLVKNEVSPRIARHTDGSAFVSEVFAGRAMGKSYAQEILDIFDYMWGSAPDFNFDSLHSTIESKILAQS
jgi:hypothetical protein